MKQWFADNKNNHGLWYSLVALVVFLLIVALCA